MPGESRKLTLLHRRFAELVVRGYSGTEALRQLGWKGDSPRDKAYKLRQLPHVREYIARLNNQAFETAGVNQVEIILALARIGRFDPRKLEKEDGTPKKLAELDDDTAAAIQGVELEELTNPDGKCVGRVRKYRAANKNEAWRELATIAGLKREEGAPPIIGPGLTVIVQQGLHVAGQPGRATAQQTRVEVTLPPPSRLPQ